MKKKWVDALLEIVCNHWHWVAPARNMFIHVAKPDDTGRWTVSVAPGVQEIKEAGPRDGEKVWTPFAFDIGNFLANPNIKAANVGVRTKWKNRYPEIIIDIVYRKRPVALRILLQPPPDVEPMEEADKDNEINPYEG